MEKFYCRGNELTKLDVSKNDLRGEFRLITTDDSKIPVYVIPTNEELLIASDTYDLINK